LSHFIEHAHNPRRLLEESFRLLKPGGRLWIDTPNIRGLGHKYFGRFWLPLDPPRHLVLFHWEALEELLKDVGFTKVARRPRAELGFSHMAAYSKRISLGQDPLDGSPSFKDRLLGWAAKVRVTFDYHRSECVTLIARKKRQGQ